MMTSLTYFDIEMQHSLFIFLDNFKHRFLIGIT